MDKIFEQEFVYQFLNRRIRERILFELNSNKKRINALMRFSHSIDDIIDERNIVSKTNVLIKENLSKIFFHNRLMVYVISYKLLDGKMMTVDDAIEHANNEYSPVIMYCDRTAIIKSEYESGSPMYYILKCKAV